MISELVAGASQLRLVSLDAQCSEQLRTGIAVVALLVRIARKARLGYDDFLYISQQARKKSGLRRGRNQMLTYLTSKGLTDSQIQLISGHESEKSLELYQHLSLESVDKAYQAAVQSVGI
jgi:hypothetical protein